MFLKSKNILWNILRLKRSDQNWDFIEKKTEIKFENEYQQSRRYINPISDGGGASDIPPTKNVYKSFLKLFFGAQRAMAFLSYQLKFNFPLSRQSKTRIMH